jgi:hypothetical protein
MIAKGMSKNIVRPQTFSEIFEGLEFERPFKKPHVLENFWSQFIIDRFSLVYYKVLRGPQ